MRDERKDGGDVHAFSRREDESRQHPASIPYETWETLLKEAAALEARARLLEEEGSDALGAAKARARVERFYAVLRDVQRTRLAKIAGEAAKANGHPPSTLWPTEKPIYEKLRTDIESIVTALVPRGEAVAASAASLPASVAPAAPTAPAAAIVPPAAPEAPKPPLRATPENTRMVLTLKAVPRHAGFDGDCGPYPADEIVTMDKRIAEGLAKRGIVRIMPEPGEEKPSAPRPGAPDGTRDEAQEELRRVSEVLPGTAEQVATRLGASAEHVRSVLDDLKHHGYAYVADGDVWKKA